MKFLLVVLAAVFVVNCKYEVGNPVEVRVDGDYTDQDGMMNMFTEQVAEASVIWRDALGPNCVDPFPLEGDGETLPITLRTPENWKYGGAIGFTPADYIEIEGPEDGVVLNDMVNAIVHEMGHVLGLQHNSDRTSVMGPRVPKIPNARDISTAKLNLGCQ